MSFCWDLLPPPDAPEMEFLRESDKYRVCVYTDRDGETVYQGEFKSSIGGGWWEDSDCNTYDEDYAIAWFDDCINPSIEDEENVF